MKNILCDDSSRIGSAIVYHLVLVCEETKIQKENLYCIQNKSIFKSGEEKTGFLPNGKQTQKQSIFGNGKKVFNQRCGICNVKNAKDSPTRTIERSKVVKEKVLAMGFAKILRKNVTSKHQPTPHYHYIPE